MRKRHLDFIALISQIKTGTKKELKSLKQTEDDKNSMLKRSVLTQVVLKIEVWKFVYLIYGHQDVGELTFSQKSGFNK